jgi:hypothetical protein
MLDCHLSVSNLEDLSFVANQCEFCILGIQVCELCGLEYRDRNHGPMVLPTLIDVLLILMVKKTMNSDK